MRSLIRVAGGAVRGRSHERAQKPCQDKYYVWRSKDKRAAGIALSDGAGSSPYSQIGAEFTVNAVIPQLIVILMILSKTRQMPEREFMNFC